MTIQVQRFFSTAGASPSEQIEWDTRTASLTNSQGETIFEQKEVRVPKSWSMSATNIVASKYFHGKLGSPARESGVDQLIGRVVDSITASGLKQNYFDVENAKIFSHELSYLLLNQYGAFNSPVEFNVGCDRYEPNAQATSWHWNPEAHAIQNAATGYTTPQCSACFINSVEDSMEGIMALAKTEAMLFKFGSGTGTNFSSLRSSKEAVSGGGKASGPLSFMRGFDAFAGVIKSGGKTRRAAKMAILNVEHPDILDFIDCKLKEDKKAQALMAMGYDGTSGPDSEAYTSVFYQNANNSVRVSDLFMDRAAKKERYNTFGVKHPNAPVDSLDASAVLTKIAEATWACGDPGMQFDDTINLWHTCKTSGRINSSNPCSEYMFLDDSACNLASLNLLKFIDKDGNFKVAAFKHAVEIFILAQDILIDFAGYPTETIGKNSHDYRPLGLGYANLGALLMALGEPYDSQIGRAFAGAVTSLMTGQAYLTSGKIAETMTALIPAGEKLIDDYELHTGHCVAAGGGKLKRSGAFPGYFINKDSFLGVMKLHRKHAQQFVSDSGSPNAALFNSAAEVWDKVLGQGKASGYRNAQVTVLAPTGTIGFMMDCDTTGIEPELALVKYKRLVGGSVMKIVNETVGAALRELGYNPAHVDELIEYIDKNGSLEGSTLQAKHLPVFDTSFKPEKGTRCIHYLGHIKMMAAVQPFLSGAISKTVNMPSDATVEDIAEAYLQAWKMGVKAVAIYRDGSKTNQVLTTKKDKGKTEPGTAGDILAGLPAVAAVLDDLNAPPHAVRHRLPDTRPAVTHKFSIAGHEGYLTVGLYKNGQPGEIFVAMAKEGSTLSGLMDSFALVFSLSLQHGVPLTTLCSKLAHTGFDPSGWTGNADLGYAKSIMDYLARWLELQFLKSKQGVLFETKPATAPVSAAPTTSTGLASSDSPACPDCGALTVRNGSCFKCMECGSTTGCS